MAAAGDDDGSVLTFVTFVTAVVEDNGIVTGLLVVVVVVVVAVVVVVVVVVVVSVVVSVVGFVVKVCKTAAKKTHFILNYQ